MDKPRREGIHKMWIICIFFWKPSFTRLMKLTTQMTIMNDYPNSETEHRTSNMTPSPIPFIFMTPFFLVCFLVVRPARLKWLLDLW